MSCMRRNRTSESMHSSVSYTHLSAEAVEVFDHFIGKLRNAVPDSVIMMISGNHDSAPRVNCFRSVLDRQKIYMIGIPPQTEEEMCIRDRPFTSAFR